MQTHAKNEDAVGCNVRVIGVDPFVELCLLLQDVEAAVVDDIVRIVGFVKIDAVDMLVQAVMD